MKTIQKLLWARGRNSRRVIHQQLELPLPGSRLTRDEIGFLADLRRIREQLAASTGRG